ncbi:MAG: SufD family Fe-S cluster assembly protein [Candidatus Thermoplasmatota archaeon]|nr:SufD family Fe-S cluster assembly protein [Candidatus Thermoplasmatota archaeon]
MEEYEDVIKKRFNDSSFDYRAKAFREYLKSPLRTFKESPTVKDYVEISSEELESMLIESDISEKEDPQFSPDSQVRILDDRIVSVSDDAKKKGVLILDYLSAVSADNKEIEPFLNSYFGSEKEEYIINAAWKNGFVIYVPEGIRGLTINIESFSDASQSIGSKNVIICGDDSSVEINDVYRSFGNGQGTHGKTVYLYVGKRSTLKYNYLQEKESEVLDIAFVKSFLSEFANFTFYHVNRGASRVLFSNTSYMEGEGSNFKTYGVSYSDASQKFDIRDSSFQTGVASSADIKVRGVVKGKSLTIHRGNIDIEEKSIKSTGFYDSRILLLSKDGYANSKPGLIIRNNNTKSKHASAISSLDREQVFYLRSRGISEAVARSMLTEGFLLANLENSSSEILIDKVHAYSEEITRERQP